MMWTRGSIARNTKVISLGVPVDVAAIYSLENSRSKNSSSPKVYIYRTYVAIAISTVTHPVPSEY